MNTANTSTPQDPDGAALVGEFTALRLALEAVISSLPQDQKAKIAHVLTSEMAPISKKLRADGLPESGGDRFREVAKYFLERTA